MTFIKCKGPTRYYAPAQPQYGHYYASPPAYYSCTPPTYYYGAYPGLSFPPAAHSGGQGQQQTNGKVGWNSDSSLAALKSGLSGFSVVQLNNGQLQLSFTTGTDPFRINYLQKDGSYTTGTDYTAVVGTNHLGDFVTNGAGSAGAYSLALKHDPSGTVNYCFTLDESVAKIRIDIGSKCYLINSAALLEPSKAAPQPLPPQEPKSADSTKAWMDATKELHQKQKVIDPLTKMPPIFPGFPPAPAPGSPLPAKQTPKAEPSPSAVKPKVGGMPPAEGSKPAPLPPVKMPPVSMPPGPMPKSPPIVQPLSKAAGLATNVLAINHFAAAKGDAVEIFKQPAHTFVALVNQGNVNLFTKGLGGAVKHTANLTLGPDANFQLPPQTNTAGWVTPVHLQHQIGGFYRNFWFFQLDSPAAPPTGPSVGTPAKQTGGSPKGPPAQMAIIYPGIGEVQPGGDSMQHNILPRFVLLAYDRYFGSNYFFGPSRPLTGFGNWRAGFLPPGTQWPSGGGSFCNVFPDGTVQVGHGNLLYEWSLAGYLQALQQAEAYYATCVRLENGNQPNAPPKGAK